MLGYIAQVTAQAYQLEAFAISKYVYELRMQGYHEAANKRVELANELYRSARVWQGIEPQTKETANA